MSLRAKFIGYLVLVHLVFAAVAIAWLWQERIWLLGVEAFFALSLYAGVRLIHHLWVPLELMRSGAELIAEGDFTSRFVEVGQPEMDQLLRVYNRMSDQLREERTHLQEQHYFMERVLQVAPLGVLTLDFDGRVEGANPGAEQILKKTVEELEGCRLDELPAPFASVLKGLKNEASQVVSLQGRRQVRCQRGRFVDRGFERGFLLLEELTEELRRSERAAYERAIRLLSHEVNNTIGSVNSLLRSCLNYKEQLREEDQEDFSTAMRVAIGRTDHLNAFMHSFAEVFKLPPPRKRPVDLRELLESVEALLRAELQRRQIEWIWEMEESIDPVEIDRTQMEQVFVNILKNAMEAIGEKGSIIVRLGERGGHACVSLEDSGGGMEPEVGEQLFIPFFSTKENGQGIGLTMVQEILEQHGFGFALESQSGGPTRFEIVFA